MNLKRYLRFQFGLKFVLLLTLIAATLTLVFMAPEPKEVAVGGALRERVNILTSVEQPSGLVSTMTSVAINDGRYELLTLEGRRLASGYFDDGSATGTWRLYHADGTLAAQGACESGFAKGKWLSWDRDGRMLCSTEYTKAQVGTYPYSYFGAFRHGTTTWYDDSSHGSVSEYQLGVQVTPEASTMASAETLERMKKQLASDEHRVRCDAIWRAKFLAQDGVKFLIEALDHESDYTRAMATLALAELGVAAKPAAPRLKQLLDDLHSPLWPSAIAALVRIEPEARAERVAQLFRSAAETEDQRRFHLMRELMFEDLATAPAFLAAYIDSKETSQRKLAGRLAIDAFYVVTKPASNVGSTRQWSRWPRYGVIEEDLPPIVEAIVDLLEHAELDEDDAIRQSVAKPLEQWRTRELVPGWRLWYMGGKSGGFFCLPDSARARDFFDRYGLHDENQTQPTRCHHDR